MVDSVQDKCVISMEYTLRLDSGEVVDTSVGREPLEFIQGQRQIIPGLEDALLGMAVGEEKDIIVAPADGYGEQEPDLQDALPRDVFPPDVEVGDSFRMRTETGHSVIVYVASVTEDEVVVDLNHPLAGETLHFHVKILGAREATEEDLAACSCGCDCSECAEGECADDDCDCADGCPGCGH